ncbi:MAG TPA: hypothetical protein VLJ60_08765 [bacterium]|nr:hypothetical protein [bacterium]
MNEPEFDSWFAQHINSAKTAFVSPDIPLLSNISAIDNIALVARFHSDIPDKTIFSNIKTLMDILDIGSAINSKPSSFDEMTRFKVKLLRAIMLTGADIVIDRPFYMIRNMPTVLQVRKILTLLDTHFEQCIIADYEWHRDRYGDLIE